VPFKGHNGWSFELAAGFLACGAVSRKSRNEAWSDTPPRGPGKGGHFLGGCTFKALGEEYVGRGTDGAEVE
jgi:hypothetical protein